MLKWAEWTQATSWRGRWKGGGITCVENAAHLPPWETEMIARQLAELWSSALFCQSVASLPAFSCFLLSLRLSQRDFLGCLFLPMARFPWRWRLSHSQFLKVVERMSPCVFPLNSPYIFRNRRWFTAMIHTLQPWDWMADSQEHTSKEGAETPQIQTFSCLKHLGIMHSSNALFFSHFTWCVSRWAKTW